MSSILKALKKLEHEKAVQKPGAFRIDADILRGDSTRKPFSTGVLLAALAFFSFGVGATYFFMRHDTTIAASPASQDSSKERVIEPLSLPAAVPSSSVAKPALRPEGQQSRPTAHLTDKTGPSARPSEHQLRQAALPLQEIPPVPQSSPPVSIPVAVKVPAALKVDGIAFQDGTADGVAVVNGVAVSKGSLIEGARVEEVQKDRVKFSRGGEKFEIILERSN
jgi:general secretion pathway protein B